MSGINTIIYLYFLFKNNPVYSITDPQNGLPRQTSWYTESGVFKNTEPTPQRKSSSNWYADVGLYQLGTSTPSSSSAENSGNTSTFNDSESHNSNEEYYNKINESNDYYNESIDSFSSEGTKTDKSLTNLPGDMHLKLQDEPLYQFYDAAVLEVILHKQIKFKIYIKKINTQAKKTFIFELI